MDDADPSANEITSKDEFANRLVAVWEKTVDTQMHFNEMSAKTRQLGLTFVAAALGLGIFIFSKSGGDAKYAYDFHFYGKNFRLHIAECIFIAAALAVFAVRQLDLGVYHQMLRGSVAFGEDLEQVHLRKMFGVEKGMTQAVSHFSRHSDASVVRCNNGGYHYLGTSQKNAGKKIAKFYLIVILSLIFCAVVMFVVDNSFV